MACRTELRFRLDLIRGLHRRDGGRKADPHSENHRKEACDHDEFPPSPPVGPKCGRIPYLPRPSSHQESPMRAKLMLTLAATAAAMVFPPAIDAVRAEGLAALTDRKSTRLNSSHGYISYAVFCLKKKKKTRIDRPRDPQGRGASGRRFA